MPPTVALAGRSGSHPWSTPLRPSTPSVHTTCSPFELLRCLVRTLYSTNGREVENGGSELRPDIAKELPVVSEDGLTWTIRLRRGLRYAPPFDDAEDRRRPTSFVPWSGSQIHRASAGGYRPLLHFD